MPALWAVILWSTVATAFKWTLRYLSAMELVALATLVSFVVLGIWVVISGRTARVGEHWRRHGSTIVLLGIINPVVYYGVLFEAYTRLPAQEAQVINYTWALMIAFLSVPFLGHRLGRYDVLGGLLGYAGVFWVATHGEIGSVRFDDPAGVGYAFASTLLWAVYWLVQTRLGVDTVVGLFANFTVGAIWAAGYLLWSGGDFWHALPWQGVVGAIYIGCFEMSVTFVLWAMALQRADRAARIAFLMFLTPFVSLVWIGLLLKEPIDYSTPAALVLIVGGMIVQRLGTATTK
jgi:drug/metabolite transporter (DMT)-like permease